MSDTMTDKPASRFAGAIRLPSVKFPEIDASVTGTVIEIGEGTVPTFDDRGRIVQNVVEKNDDGTDRMQVEVTLDVADATKGAANPGTRNVLHTDGAVFYAIGRALAEIGADDLNVGDILTVTYTSDGEPTAKGRNAPKQYTAKIVAG